MGEDDHEEGESVDESGRREGQGMRRKDLGMFEEWRDWRWAEGADRLGDLVDCYELRGLWRENVWILGRWRLGGKENEDGK